MKKHLFLFLLLALSLGACRSLRMRDFHTNESITPRLPRLGLLVHERSFGEAFGFEFMRENVINGYPSELDPWIAYQVNDQAIDDVFRMLDNELDDNLNQPLHGKYGFARFKLLAYQRNNTGWGWTVASISTLMMPNLLGMPFGTYQSELELQMEIVDADDKVLARYTASGAGKAKVALYHGYNGGTGVRKANLIALQNAMSKIKTKLVADAPALAEQLESAGEIRKSDGK